MIYQISKLIAKEKIFSPKVFLMMKSANGFEFIPIRKFGTPEEIETALSDPRYLAFIEDEEEVETPSKVESTPSSTTILTDMVFTDKEKF